MSNTINTTLPSPDPEVNGIGGADDGETALLRGQGTLSTEVNGMTAVEKDQVLGLLERLDGTQRTAAVSFIQFLLLDPVARAVAMAPPDDEPVTDEDRRRFHEGQAWFDQRGGKGIPMDDVLSEFGFRPEDFIVNQ